MALTGRINLKGEPFSVLGVFSVRTDCLSLSGVTSIVVLGTLSGITNLGTDEDFEFSLDNVSVLMVDDCSETKS